MIAARRNLYELKGTTKDGAVYNFGNNIKELDHTKFNYYLGVVDVLIPCNKYHSSNCLTVVPEFYVPKFDISFQKDEKHNTYHPYEHEGQKYNNFESFRDMIKSALIKFSEKHLIKKVIENGPKVDDFKIKFNPKEFVKVSYDSSKQYLIDELLENKVTVDVQGSKLRFNDFCEYIKEQSKPGESVFLAKRSVNELNHQFPYFMRAVIGSRATINDFKLQKKGNKWKITISYEKNNKLQKQVIDSMLNEPTFLSQYFKVEKNEPGSLVLDTLKTYFEENHLAVGGREVTEKINFYLNSAIKAILSSFDINKYKFEMFEGETHISFPVKTIIEYPPESSYFEQIFGIPKYTIFEANQEYIFEINSYSQFNLLIKSNIIDGPLFRWNVEHNKKKSSFITPNNILYFPLKDKQSILDEIKITFGEIENNLPISVMVDFIIKEKLSDGNGNVYKILL